MKRRAVCHIVFFFCKNAITATTPHSRLATDWVSFVWKSAPEQWLKEDTLENQASIAMRKTEEACCGIERHLYVAEGGDDSSKSHRV